MHFSEEDTSTHRNHRWYDQDPALQNAIEQLRFASDDYQAQIALNIIKIIVEHQIESETSNQAEALTRNDSTQPFSRHRRWYDLQETLSSAMQLLADCPVDLKRQLLPSITRMIETVLSTPEP